MADDNLMDQNEIEQLLNQGKTDSPPDAAEQPPAADAPAGDSPENSLDQNDIESLLNGGSAPEQQPPADQSQPADEPKAAPAIATGEDDDKLLGQDDIEKLLNQAGTGADNAEPKPEPKKKDAAAESVAGEGDVPQDDIEYLLNQAEEALESIDSKAEADLPQGVAAFRLEEFSGAPASTEVATLDLIRDVELDLKIELGRTHMYIEDVLKLRKGSVVPLDKLAGDPVDIYVNERLIARGEVLVLNDNFCVRVAELVAGTDVLV